MVVRVEDCSLAEIRCTPRDLLGRSPPPPTGTLPGLSVVLNKSIAHLGQGGLTHFAVGLVCHMGAVEANLGSAVGVLPYIPALSAACGEQSLIADLFDHDCRLVFGGMGLDRTLDCAREASWGLVGGGGGGRWPVSVKLVHA